MKTITFNFIITFATMAMMGYFFATMDNFQLPQEKQDAMKAKFNQVSFRDPKAAAEHAKKLEELNKKRKSASNEK